MSTIIPEKTGAVTLTKAPVRATDTCPSWCDANHDQDSEHWRTHQKREFLSVLYGKAIVRLRWWEGRTPGARFQDKGPEIWFATAGSGQLTLTASKAGRLALIMQELGQDEVAGLLRQAADMATDGAL